MRLSSLCTLEKPSRSGLAPLAEVAVTHSPTTHPPLRRHSRKGVCNAMTGRPCGALAS